MTSFTRRYLANRATAAAIAPVLAGAVPSGLAQQTGGTYPAVAQSTPRDLLTGRYSPEKIASVLVPRERWHPYPPAADRAAWEAIPADIRSQFIDAGEQALNAAWPELSATRMLEYTRIGNRTRYDSANAARREKLRTLVMAETAEAKGRFLDEILNGIWLFSEQTFWGSPAHVHYQKAGAGLPDISDITVDLFVGEAASELAWTIYFLGPALDKISPLIRERVHLEVDRRMLTPCLATQQHWMVRGMNWNPWCSSNWLMSSLLLERDEKRRAAAVYKILRCLDNFLNLYPDDGGCDEGPSYWGQAGGRLFRCLELLHSATNGAVDIFQVPLIKEIGRYIYRVHIYDRWVVNFADASARSTPRGSLVYRYGRRIGDERMIAFGAWAMQQNASRRSQMDLDVLFQPENELASASAHQPLVRDVWLKDIQVMAARVKEGSPDGFYMAALAGHNAESHNHNDVGNFIVFYNGEPVIIDVGPEAYSARTFSKERYSIWTMSSAYHNLPTIGGIAQRPGRDAAASDVSYKADDHWAELSMDIAKAYPPEAGLESWHRVLRLDRRQNRVEVVDRYVLAKSISEITLTLMSPCPVTIGPAELQFQTRAGIVRTVFEGPGVSAKVEEIPIQDERLKGVWGDRLWRVLIYAAKPPARGDWRLVFTAVG